MEKQKVWKEQFNKNQGIFGTKNHKCYSVISHFHISVIELIFNIITNHDKALFMWYKHKVIKRWYYLHSDHTVCKSVNHTNTFSSTTFPPSPISRAHYFLHWAPDSFSTMHLQKGTFLALHCTWELWACSWEDATWKCWCKTGHLYMRVLMRVHHNVKMFSVEFGWKWNKQKYEKLKLTNFSGYLCQRFRVDSQNWEGY